MELNNLISDLDLDDEYDGVTKIRKGMHDTFCFLSVNEEIARRAGKPIAVHPVMKLWFDTMASNSITNDVRLFGKGGPTDTCDFNVVNWNDETLKVTKCGMTAFGMMLFDDRCCGTLLAAYEMKRCSKLKWVDEDVAVSCIMKADASVTLNFSMTNEERVLVCDVDDTTYIRICNMHYSAEAHDEQVEEVKILRATLDQGSFARSMEVIHAHQVSCHACMEYISMSAQLQLLSNMPFNKGDVSNVILISDGKCPCCALAKCTKDSINPNNKYDHSSDSTLPDYDKSFPCDPESSNETVAFDYMFIDGKPVLVGMGRNKGYVHVVPTGSRTAKKTKKAIELIIGDYKRFGVEVVGLANGKKSSKSPHRTRANSMVVATESDNEAAFVDNAISSMSRRYKIYSSFVVAGEHVAYIERVIRTIKERVMSMRLSLKFPLNDKLLMWLVAHATMWINILFSKRSPLSAWRNMTNKILNYRDITRTKFGDVVVCSRTGILTKGQSRGELGLSLGANPRQPGAIFFYSFESRRVKTRLRFKSGIDIDCTATLGINKTYVEPAAVAKSYLQYVKKRNLTIEQLMEAETEPPDNSGGDKAVASGVFMNDHDVEELPEDFSIDGDDTKVPSEKDATVLSVRTVKHMVQQSKSGYVEDRNINWNRAMGRVDPIDKKTAYDAVMSELRQIVVDYSVCTPISPNMRVDNFHMSHDLYDTLKNKARLVVGRKIKDVIIEYGVELNSPTVNGKLMNVMLSTCLQMELDLEVWDVKGAFLKAPLHTEGVYVKLQSKIVDLIVEMLTDNKLDDYLNRWSKARRTDGSVVVEVHKGWYGLACCSMLWYEEISTTLMETCGYTRHHMDKCLFYRKDPENGYYSFVLLHVDDMAVMTNPKCNESSRLKKILETKYEQLKVQTGDTVKYVGFEIRRDRTNNKFELTMHDYISRMYEKHVVDNEDNRAVNNPASCDEFSNMRYKDDCDNLDYDNKTEYRSMVMGMQYATLVQPACKYHIISLATRQSCPRVGDYKRAVRVLKYMRVKSHKPLYIYAYGVDPIIYTYTDAAHDVYPDSMSHTGVSVFLGSAGGCMYSRSGKQKCVTDSSTGAEVVAASDGIHISQYFRLILAEFGIICKVVQYQDNMSCIALVEAGCSSYDKKDRHIVRRINILTEHFKNDDNKATMVWCETAWMIADGLTKDLHGISFDISENILMGHVIGEVGEYGIRVKKVKSY
jgi:hypothetical protein